MDVAGLDASFLYAETATAHMHTIKVAVVDVSERLAELTPELFAELLAGRVARIAALRLKPVPLPFVLGHPVWVDDPGLDVAAHIDHRRLEPPGDRRQLCEVIADVAAVPLPRDRPLWHLTVVDGLDSGRVAFVMKVHHALADGGAAVEILRQSFAVDAPGEEPRPTPGEAMPSRAELWRRAARHVLAWIRGVPQLVSLSVRGALAARRARLEAAVEVPGPFSAPRTPFNTSLTADRTFAVASLSMTDVRAIRDARGVSVNDVFLAVVSGALRRYLKRRGALPSKDLVCSVPVSTAAGVHDLGNKFDNLYVPLPVGLADPLRCLDSIRASVRAARRVRDALGPDLLAMRAFFAPPALYHWVVVAWTKSRLASHLRPPLNLVASSVAGPRTVLEVDGGRLDEMWSVGPILEGIGLNVTAWSYVDRLDVSILGCSASLEDPWELADDIDAALVALRAAALRN